MRMLTSHEIELIAGGWGSSQDIFGFYKEDGSSKDYGRITVTAPIPGGHAGPDTGNYYPGDPADLRAGGGRDISQILELGAENARWLIDKAREAKKDWHAREAAVDASFDKQKIAITIDHKASDFNKALGFDHDWIIWRTHDGRIFADTNGNRAADTEFFKDNQGHWWATDGQVDYRLSS